MGELYEKYKYQKELEEQNIIRENTIIENSIKERDDLDKSIRSIKEAREAQIAKFGKFKSTLKDVLLSEALSKLFKKVSISSFSILGSSLLAFSTNSL